MDIPISKQLKEYEYICGVIKGDSNSSSMTPDMEDAVQDLLEHLVKEAQRKNTTVFQLAKKSPYGTPERLKRKARRLQRRRTGRIKARMRAHLRKKIRDTLRSGNTFSFHRRQRGWGMSSWKDLSGTPNAHKALSRSLLDNVTEVGLPHLQSNLKPQRSGQLPPLVDVPVCAAWLEQVFDSCQRLASAFCLSDHAWRVLQPPPFTVQLHEDEKPINSDVADEKPINSDVAARCAQAAQDIWTNRLNERQQKYVVARHRGVVGAALAEELAVSKATVSAIRASIISLVVEAVQPISDKTVDKVEPQQIAEYVQDYLALFAVAVAGTKS